MDSKTYIVTGCAGFIGAKIAGMLLEQGHEVIGLDTLSDYYSRELKKWRLDRLSGKTHFFFIQQLCSLSAMKTDDISGVIHLAAYPGVRNSIKHPHQYFVNNIALSEKLLEFCRIKGIKTFIFASSSSVYGDQEGKWDVKETSSNYPISPYAASKKCVEVLAHAYHKSYGINVGIARYFSVYGPAGRPDMAPLKFIHQIAQGLPITIYGDGEQCRDYTYIDDVADATLQLLGKCEEATSYYDVHNVCRGKTGHDGPRSLHDLIYVIQQELDLPATIQYKDSDPADPLVTCGVSTYGKGELNWRAKTGLEDGIKQTVGWYKENEEWLRGVL